MFKKRVPPKEVSEEDSAIKHPIKTNEIKQGALKKLRILFTNADQLTSFKIMELKERIIKEKPHIIAISKVKPKCPAERTLQDYEVSDYDIHPSLNTLNTRKVAIYTHKSISHLVLQITHPINFHEQCLIEIRLSGKNTMIFGCIYRSPSHNSNLVENNEKLNSLLRTISLDKKYSHRCLVGDFNYKTIN